MFGTLLKKRDFYAGGLMTLLGAAVSLDSLTYTLGSLTHMGPGMFPLMLGLTLTFIGVLILGTAIVSPLGDNERILPEQPEWFAWACILGGPIAFIILGEFFGLIPATFACVFMSETPYPFSNSTAPSFTTMTSAPAISPRPIA